MQFFRSRSTLVAGAIVLAVAVGAVGIFAVDDVDEAFAQISGNDDEVEGLIEALPASGVVGTWQVAGRTITVTEATEIDREGQTLAVGIRVEVEGVVQPDGSIAASEIEVDDVDRDGDDDGDRDRDDDDGGPAAAGAGVVAADDDD